jgi:hypothetical protein
MSRLLSPVMASVLVLGLTAAMGQTLDTSPQKNSDEYKMAKDPCKNPSEAGKEQCAKELKATDESSRLRCGKLADQARRECVLEAFVQQHDRMNSGARIEKSAGAPSAGAQPK